MSIDIRQGCYRSCTETDGLASRIDRELMRVKWLLWHGNHCDGADAADMITWDLDPAVNNDAKLEKALNQARCSTPPPNQNPNPQW